MTPERWSEIERVYHLARGQPPPGRSAFLAKACDGDDQLRREVESLLGHAEGAEEYLNQGVLEAVDRARELPSVAIGTLEPGENAGAVIARYRLLQKIGEGGMGEVWLAEQEEPVRLRVALKLVKAGMNTREVIARFESERQALALMNHPAIAKVYDAGSTAQGAPYFAMEYVAGVAITAYCDKNRLTIRQRLELFVHVCEGVQHAHQKAIIHRDLKPSNILVTEVDGHPSPKIIDFGIAKALTRNLTADPTLTRAGILVGTPAYMSPEQAKTSNEVLDTRSDVYSLGVIFYELLVGVHPIEMGTLAFDEFLVKLREEEPAKPSSRMRTQEQTASGEVAHKRQTESATLIKEIRGDLDSIALKALDKEQSRRYSSPSDFAADIERYLRNDAVLAVPSSAGYRAGKFVRRYRGILAAISAFMVVILVAAGVSIWQSVRANREAAVAQAVNDFLQNDLLGQASAANQSGPATKPDPHLEVRTALDRAASRIGGKFDHQPEVEAAIRETIGQTYIDLGLYPEARTQLERALVLQRRVLGSDNPNTLKTIGRLGRVSYLQGRYPESEALYSEILTAQRRVLGPEHPDTLRSMNGLAGVYVAQGKFAQAEELHGETLEMERRVLGVEHPDTLRSMNNLAMVYVQQGKYAQAEALYNQTLEIRRRVLGPEHPNTLNSMNNLANVYYAQGKYVQAEALDAQTLEIRRHVLGPEHPDTLISMNNLANVYFEHGKYAQAEALYRQALAVQRRVLGPEHADTLNFMSNLANTYYKEGKYTQAEVLQSQSLEIRRRVLGPEHPDTLESMNNLAMVYVQRDKYAQAEPLFSQTLAIRRRVLGAEHPSTLETISSFDSMYQRQGRFDLAELYAAQALAGQRRTLGSEHPDTSDSAADLALALLSQGKFGEAGTPAREAVQFDEKKRPDDWHRFRAESLLGASLAGQKKYAEAESLLVEGYQGMLARKELMGVPDWYCLNLAHGWTVKLYEDWGKPAKAAEWRKK